MRPIPTQYRGVPFKSRLEADVAFLLDTMRLEWKYEPPGESYLLPDGTHYMPDFWVPKLSLWIEPRGADYEKGNLQLSGFRRMLNDKQASYLTIGPTEVVLQDHHTDDGYGASLSMEVHVGFCNECSSGFFYPLDYGWQCRGCGAYDGNGHFGDEGRVEFHAGLFVDGRDVRTWAQRLNDLPPYYKRRGVA